MNRIAGAAAALAGSVAVSCSRAPGGDAAPRASAVIEAPAPRAPEVQRPAFVAPPAIPVAAVAAPSAPVAAAAPARKWYQGGNLSDVGALEWQKATHENKLATCADILSFLWDGGKLKPKIAAGVSSVDDLRGPAEQLVLALDKALAGSADPRENEKQLANQKVSETALVLLVMMGWV